MEEEWTCFVGVCACDHDEEKHGWGKCGIEDPDSGQECPCEAGWEE